MPGASAPSLLKKGDSVSAILRDLGATADDIKAITAALRLARPRHHAAAMATSCASCWRPASGGKRLQPVRVIIATDSAVEAIVAWSDKGKYVSVDPRSANSVASAASDDEEDDGKGVRLYQSIYETALRNQVPRPVIDDLIRVYSYDVDFQRKVQPGDSFEILFAGEDENANDGSKTEVLFASLTTGGETTQVLSLPDRPTTTSSTITTRPARARRSSWCASRWPTASSARASARAIIRSSAPRSMHTGVDWGAGMGTPIFASGNGVIEKVGLEGGYGKYIRIRHANGYETAYGHMSAFARGMEPGKRVRQGQVIGYVGSTGLSTGAHLHYEILINGRFVDPMKIKLPRGRVLEGALLAGFEQERDRLDNMMTRAHAVTLCVRQLQPDGEASHGPSTADHGRRPHRRRPFRLRPAARVTPPRRACR